MTYAQFRCTDDACAHPQKSIPWRKSRIGGRGFFELVSVLRFASAMNHTRTRQVAEQQGINREAPKINPLAKLGVLGVVAVNPTISGNFLKKTTMIGCPPSVGMSLQRMAVDAELK